MQIPMRQKTKIHIDSIDLKNMNKNKKSDYISKIVYVLFLGPFELETTLSFEILVVDVVQML